MCGKRARVLEHHAKPRSPGSSSFTTSSPMTISPEVGVSRPEIMLRVVVFPQPDGPTMMRNSPSSIRRFTPATATTDPKCLTRSRRTISATAFLPRIDRSPVLRAPHPHSGFGILRSAGDSPPQAPLSGRGVGARGTSRARQGRPATALDSDDPVQSRRYRPSSLTPGPSPRGRGEKGGTSLSEQHAAFELQARVPHLRIIPKLNPLMRCF